MSPVPSRGTLRSSLVPHCDAHVPVRSRCHRLAPAARSAPRSSLTAMLTCLSAHDVTGSLPRHAPLLARPSLRCSRACPLTMSPARSRGTLRSSLVPHCDAHVPVRSRCHRLAPAARSAPRSSLPAMLTCLSAHDVTGSPPPPAPLLAPSPLRCPPPSPLPRAS